MIKTRMYGVSERHRGTPDKPNEDAYFTDEKHGIAIVADGVSRIRGLDGFYPPHSTVAPQLFVKEAHTFLCGVASHADDVPESPESVVRKAMQKANRAIRQAQQELGVLDAVSLGMADYLEATGCVLWICQDAGTTLGVVGFIGDTLLFHLPHNGMPRLLTRDQLHNCHRYGKTFFRDLAVREHLSAGEVKRQRLFWQRKEVRNRKAAVDPDGRPIGYGVLNGEGEALDFVETAVVRISAKDRFLLASDALRVCATTEGDEPETAEHYRELLSAVQVMEAVDAPRAILEQIRQKEVHSDDATAVLVELP